MEQAEFPCPSWKSGGENRLVQTCSPVFLDHLGQARNFDQLTQQSALSRNSRVKILRRPTDRPAAVDAGGCPACYSSCRSKLRKSGTHCTHLLLRLPHGLRPQKTNMHFLIMEIFLLLPSNVTNFLILYHYITQWVILTIFGS